MPRPLPTIRAELDEVLMAIGTKTYTTKVLEAEIDALAQRALALNQEGAAALAAAAQEKTRE